MSQFTWLPFFEEMLDNICKNYDKHSLCELFHDIFNDYGGHNDELIDGSKGYLKEIDPLTFIGYFNRKIKIKDRFILCERARIKMSLTTSLPVDLDAIPSIDSRNSWFFGYERERGANDIDNLWEFAKCLNVVALNDEIFKKVLKIKNVGLGKLSVLMFICKPTQFISLDETNINYFQSQNILDVNNIKNEIQNSETPIGIYESFKNDIANHFNPKNFYEISYSAFVYREQQGGERYEYLFQEKFNFLINRFKNIYPDFVDFQNYGKAFFEDEIRYKRKLLDKYQTEVGNEKISSLIEVGEGQKALKEISRTLGGNLVHFQSWRVCIGDTNEQATTILKTFLQVSSQDYINGDTIKPIIDEIQRQGLKPLWDTVSTILWGMRPDTYVPIKVSYFRKLSEELGIPFPKGRVTAKSFHKVMNWLKGFRNILESEEYQPKDWIDVHSFIWCVCPKDIPEPPEKVEKKYWVIAPGDNARLWNDFKKNNIIAIGWDKLGDLSQYPDKDSIQSKIREYYDSETSKTNSALSCYEFAKGMQVGDFVFAKKGVSEILGFGEITSDCRYDRSKDEMLNLRDVKWLNIGNWNLPDELRFPLKTLTDITNKTELVNELLKIIQDVPPLPKPPVEAYTKEMAMENLFISETRFDEIISLIEHKKNIILQGAPGVGKTFIAKRLAYYLIGQKDDQKAQMVQFHQSYSYEDFIQGYRPNDGGKFELQNGVFYNFCKKAQRDPSNKYVFIIDEINRGNLSKIFGELMMLIESDKRGKDFQIPLTYSTGEAGFHIPSNMYFIGTMNTADRSLAMVDYALRRRFAFVELEPHFTHKFKQFLLSKGISEATIDLIHTRMSKLNEAIRNDGNNLGVGYRIGHSFFCPTEIVQNEKEWLDRIINYEIKPLIEEYCFDNSEKAQQMKQHLNS